MNAEGSEEPISLPITCELDLHTFHPAEVTSLLDEYFRECVKRKVHQVRVIHGKGSGALRATVRAYLRRSPAVANFRVTDPPDGGWGATWVNLRPQA